MRSQPKTIAVIVAHPDDEILWAGGMVLMHPRWQCFVTTLCRASDAERAPRFYQALRRLGANGIMGDLDDGPDQCPLDDTIVQETIFASLPPVHFDLVLTHGPCGEYTSHRRHEETCRAVVRLWKAQRLSADALWMFAYEDGDGRYLPQLEREAHLRQALPEKVWQEKHRIITELYGFAPDSWEAYTVPRDEAFWCFDNPADAETWVCQRERKLENPVNV